MKSNNQILKEIYDKKLYRIDFDNNSGQKRKGVIVLLKTFKETDAEIKLKENVVRNYAEKNGIEVVQTVIRTNYGLFTPSVELENIAIDVKRGLIDTILLFDIDDLVFFYYDLVKMFFELLGAKVIAVNRLDQDKV